MRRSVLQLEVRATASESTVKFFVTTTPHVEAGPVLPEDRRVTVASVTKKKARLKWKPAVTSAHLQPITYCVAANLRRNFPTHCSFLAAKTGNQPPAVPHNSGFGFSWERQESRKRNAAKKSERGLKLRSKEFVYQCVGSSATALLKRLKPGKKYFFNVYAVRGDTNMSAAYEAASATTLSGGRAWHLKDGQITSVTLKKSTSSNAMYKYHLRHHIPLLRFGFSTCIGDVSIDISTRGRRLRHFRSFEGVKTVALPNPTPGLYEVKIRANRKKSRQVALFVATSEKRFPFPSLPNDTSIQVFERLRTCNSVTLAWLGSNEKLKYCLYKMQERNSVSRLFAKQNYCEAPSARKRTEKVRCVKLRRKRSSQAVVSQTVRGLRPATTYVFDVYATQYRKTWLQYERVRVTTRATC